MNKNTNKLWLMGLTLLTLLPFYSCNNAEYSSLDNRLFLAETATSSNARKKITIDDQGANVTATVRSSNPAGQDVKVTLVADPAALEAYNKRNSTNFVALPVENFKLDQTEIVIKKGETLAPTVNITLKGLSKEMVETGNQYALALTAKPIDGTDVTVIDGANTIIYQIDQVIVTSVPVLGTDPKTGVYHSASAPLAKDLVLSAWTVEMRVNMSGFQRNNQALFGIWGPDSEIYMRFGDAPTPFNTLQVKFAGSQFDRSIKEFEPNTWYHIAVTYDGSIFTLYINGEEDVNTDKWPGKVTTARDKIYIASSGREWFVNGCMMSEVRLWNISRTKEQIINNQYTINPKTEGLIMYWKMNEGQGHELKNSVSGAPNLIIEPSTPLRWLDNVRSDNKGRINFND
ncbi:MAG: DUF1735 and LamG domain-containing protein [Bacteroidia bacterium]|nr:DUF1735 and LamG domain-containing protein [Bacteroidia bacterium]